MAVVVSAPPALTGELALFHTTDPLLSNSPVLVFHGPAATIGATSSRIQVHVFTPAGIGSYARLAVSPNSPFYSAVSNLPREEQGDEVCRGVAFGLKKYFLELPETVKKTWCTQAKAPSPSALFGDHHIAILASRMTRIENVDEVIGTIAQAFGEQRQSWLDVDVVLPPGSIKEITKPADSIGSEDLDETELLHQQYGRYAELVSSLGDLTFLPTSKLKRAPSKPTAVGRSASFLKHQKETVRREFYELLDTEESYVERIKELRSLSSTLGADLKTTSRQQLKQVFPATIENILDVNTRFLEAFRSILDETETVAAQDIAATQESLQTTQQARSEIRDDTQGVNAIAKCLCEWLPHFADSYGAYLQAHSQSTQLLRTLLRSPDTAMTAELQEVGEQKLTSLLIEPVQRLPRYNLYIDSITKQLPVRHPAIKNLLKARDIITDICVQEDMDSGMARVEERLRSCVSGWPADARVTGRLVTAIDCIELAPPFTLQGCDGQPILLLLFSDSLVMLEKQGTAAVSAKTFMTEIETGVKAPSAEHRPTTPHGLRFSKRIRLSAFDCTESHDGQVLQVFSRFELAEAARPAQQSTTTSCHVLRLEGAYDNKAARLTEEIAKARVEGRFSEAERESVKWEFRATAAAVDHVNLLSAVFDDSDAGHIAARSECAPVRVIIDLDRHSQRPRAGDSGIRTVVALSPTKDGAWRLTVDSVDGPASHEHVAASNLATTLSQKLGFLSNSRFDIEQPAISACLLSKNADILRSIDLQARVTEDDADDQHTMQEPVRRPISPRKLLSTFLSSTGPGSQPPGLLKKDLPPLPPPSQVSRYPTTGSTASKPPSRDSRPTSKDQETSRPLTSMRSTDQLSNPTKKLEETLSTYMLALQARKGNIVGRSLKMRATADELAVNELYNSVLENPNMMVFAAQATVDVLFAAFEKFLNVAWKEQIGQVVPFAVMRDIQSKAETLFPVDFDDYFRSALSTLPPQNQRAFKSIMKLLADLLDGTGNDGDRGILTAAFAEVLVTDGNPHDYIALIDRFVDDTDTYFGETMEDSHKTADGCGGMHKRARSVNSASISSNTSSLRKKFGFTTLSRNDSKSEQESKVASVWRTLSKSTRGDTTSPAGSISKSTLHRSHSTDVDSRVPPRPSSQDGITPFKPTLGEDVPNLSGPASALNLGLSTIGEHPSFIPTGPPKKKRRSSLSDLKVLDAAQAKSPLYSPPSVRRPPLAQRHTDDKSLPASPMPSTPSSKGGSGRFGSPTRETPRSRLPSSFRREASPSANKLLGMPEPLRPRSNSKPLDEVVITTRPTSGIPTLALKTSSPPKAASPMPLRSGLSERRDAGNMVKRPSPQPEKAPTKTPVSSTIPTDTTSPTKKLRMQSPQKLRERLQNEHSALSAAQTILQDELSKIGDELTSTPSRIGSVRATPLRSTPLNTRHTTQGAPPSTIDLAARVLKTEAQLVSHVDELSARLTAISADLASSLTVSENKCKKLDELYRESHSENEALYARFNDELGRILKAVRGGEGVEELRKAGREGQEEVARLRRENGRLRRENVGLRAQLRE